MEENMGFLILKGSFIYSRSSLAALKILQNFNVSFREGGKSQRKNCTGKS